MTEENLEDTPPPEIPAPVAPEKDSVTQFIEAAKNLIPAEKAKLYLRITPQGLFTQKEFLPNLIELYQDWFSKKTNGGPKPSVSKVIKRFFTSPLPALYYLVESKQCMVGHLVRRPFPQLELVGLPVYIGSVDDTRNNFNPRDPLLLCLPHVELQQDAHGQRFKVQTQSRKYSFSTAVLKEFSRLAQRSPKLKAAFPDTSGALRDGLKAMISALEQARPVKDKQRILVPVSQRNKPDVKYLCLGTLTLVVEKDGNIVYCYDVDSRVLSRFVKTEFIGLYQNPATRRHGIIEILPPRSRQLAAFSIRGYKLTLHPSAFISLLRTLMFNPPDDPDFPLKYSVKSCLTVLSDQLQLAEEIDRKMILRHVQHIRGRSLRYYINKRWIFVINRRHMVVACVDRFHQGPGAGFRGRH